MTDTQLSELKRLAQAATSGPWKIAFNKDIYHVSLDGNYVDICDNGYDGTGGIQNSKDAAYIAAANPAVILELIAELEEYHTQCQSQ